MEVVAPAGPVYQAGTLSGNPLATTAGIATLEPLFEPGLFATIEDAARTVADGIRDLAAATDIPIQVGQVGTILGFYFLKESGVEITDAASAKLHAHTARYAEFFHFMLEEGVYFAPSQFEVAFTSAAHGEQEVRTTLQAVEKAFARLTAG